MEGTPKDYIGQQWPFPQLSERGEFMRALLGEDDWAGLDATDLPQRLTSRAGFQLRCEPIDTDPA
jgi:hypothetical protein